MNEHYVNHTKSYAWRLVWSKEWDKICNDLKKYQQTLNNVPIMPPGNTAEYEYQKRIWQETHK